MANHNTMKRGSTIDSNPNSIQNHPCRLLNREENELLYSIIGQRCVSLASAVVQLLFSDPSSHSRWVKKYCGVACFIKDYPKKSFFIRIFDIMEQVVLWEHELYHEINYHKALPFFHTFETDDRQAGLNFANEEEAEHFFKMVHDKIRLLQRKREDNQRKRDGLNNHHVPKVNAVTAGENGSIGRQNSVNNTSYTPHSVQVPFPAGNLNNAPANNDDKKKKPKPRRISKQDIGLPTHFQHISHIGWDPDKGLEYDETDPMLQVLFKKAGIDIKKTDADTRDFIYGFIESEFGGIQNVKKKAVVHSQTPQGAQHVPPPPPRSQQRPPANHLQPQSATRPLPPPRTPPTHPRPATKTHAPPPVPVMTVGVRPPVLAKTSAAPPRPTNGSLPSAVVSSAPAPPPPPPPPPFGGPAAAGSWTGVPTPPPMPVNLSPGTPSSPEIGDSRSALMDDIKKGRQLKKVDTASVQPNLSERDKLLSEIANGITLKHVDPEKDSLGRNEASEPLDGMAALLAKALAQRRIVIEEQDGTDDNADASDDDEWDE